MSINWLRDATPEPALLVLPAEADSLDEAHAAIELWEHYSGKVLDPTQRLMVEIMMARSGSRWAAATTGREMPRQNGKGDELEVVELWGLVHLGEAILHTVHEAVLLASQTQDRMLSLLELPDFKPKVKRVWRGTGQQMIEMKNGGVIWYRTRSGGGGRGLDDVTRIVVDEAQHVTAEQLSATTPTGFAAENSQLNFVGTAGLDGVSSSWWRVRRRAVSVDPGRFGYMGHTAETLHLEGDQVVQVAPDDVSDEDLWLRVNPALRRRGQEGLEFLREQYRNLGPEQFAQEHLCVWAPDPQVAVGAGPLPLEAWDELVDGSSVANPERARLALDRSPDRSWTTVSVASVRPDGLHHVEVIRSQPGTAWVVEVLRDAAERFPQMGPVVVGKSTPAESLLQDLDDAGIAYDLMSPSDQAAATGRLIDACRGEAPKVRHLGQPALRKAVSLAQAVPYGDGGLSWSRKRTKDDISPLTTVTMAYGRLGEEPSVEPWVFFK